MCNKEQYLYPWQKRAIEKVQGLTKIDWPVKKDLNISLPAATNHLTGNIEPLPHVYNFKQEK